MFLVYDQTQRPRFESFECFFVNIYCVYSFELHDIKISKNLDGHLILVYDHDIKISKGFRQSGIIHL